MMRIESTHVLTGSPSELTVGDIRQWLDDDTIEDGARVDVSVNPGDAREPGSVRLSLHLEPKDLR